MNGKEFAQWFAHQLTQRCYDNAPPESIVSLEHRLRLATGKHAFLSDAKIIEGDVRSIGSKELMRAAGLKRGEFFLVAGGPPCQPFSRAGKRETVEVEDGQLFMEFVRIVRDTRPRWFLFENVKGLAQSRTVVPYVHCRSCNTKSPSPFEHRSEILNQRFRRLVCPFCGNSRTKLEILDVRGGSLEIILQEFKAIGYRCYNAILNAANFGVPQSRERLFIVGSRDGEAFAWPSPTHYDSTLSANGANNLAAGQLSLIGDEVESLRPYVTVKETLWQEGHPVYGPLDYDRAVLWVKNVVRPHAEPVTWLLNRPSPTVGAHQAAKLAIAPYGVPEEQLARQQWHVKGRRQRDLPPVDVCHEYLSDQELLTLQTFPASWYLFGTRMQRAFQIGNAVPPLLAKAVGEALLKASGIAKKECYKDSPKTVTA